MKTLIGIDPGLTATGYGVIRTDGSRFIHICHGVIRTDPRDGLADRLLWLHHGIRKILIRYKPEEAGVEELYFSKNIRSAIPVAEARGVILLALGARGIQVAGYTPQQLKQAVLGKGKAEKGQIQRIVSLILGLEEPPAPSHAADALAIAICHANRSSVHVQ